MRRGILRSAGPVLAKVLAVSLCLGAANIVRADEGIFWEATAPGRPVLILMPTIHTLPDEARDISAVLYQALQRVNSVVIESPTEGVTPAEKDAMHQRMTYPEPDSLEHHLTVMSVPELHACADKAHLPYHVAIHFRPYALTLAIMNRTPGPKPHEGIDTRLARGARIGHRDVMPLISTVENVDFMGSMPQRLQELVLRHACTMLDNPGHNEVITAMADDWRRADADALSLDLEKPVLPGDSPELLKANDFLYAQGTDRFFAALMSERIQSMKGPVLVAVGAGHYLGRFSMIPGLQKAGYSVRRARLNEFPVIPFAPNVAATPGSENPPQEQSH